MHDHSARHLNCLQDANFKCSRVQSTAKERAKHAGDYFTLLRHLLNYAYNSNINLPNAEVLLNNEIDWLKRIRVKAPAHHMSEEIRYIIRSLRVLMIHNMFYLLG